MAFEQKNLVEKRERFQERCMVNFILCQTFKSLCVIESQNSSKFIFDKSITLYLRRSQSISFHVKPHLIGNTKSNLDQMLHLFLFFCLLFSKCFQK